MKPARAWLLALIVAGASARAEVPKLAQEHLPTLRAVQRQIWPDAPEPWFLAGQIEQESCVKLTSPRCWNPRVELKTSAEYGFGLGQTTIAYRKDGTVRFNKWQELRSQFGSLAGWTWERRYEARYQLTALVEMDRAIYDGIQGAATLRERLAFTLSAYNGGASGVLQDRLLCRHTGGCDPSRWFGHVELYSLKSKAVRPGYGKSPYAINREYPRNVLDLRRAKYEPYFKD